MNRCYLGGTSSPLSAFIDTTYFEQYGRLTLEDTSIAAFGYRFLFWSLVVIPLFIDSTMTIRRLPLSTQIILYPVTFKHCFQPSKAQNIYFSTSNRHSAYSDTVSNLNIGAHTRVIFQGFTGRQVCPAAPASPLLSPLTSKGHAKRKTVFGVWHKNCWWCYARQRWRAPWAPGVAIRPSRE